MQRIEPTGAVRMEWYLCRILAALLSSGFGGSDKGFEKLIIGYEEREQTLEEALREMNRFG